MKFFTVALVLALAVAANASIGALGWGAGIYGPGAWAAGPYAAGAWGPAAAHWGAAPAAVTVLATPGAGHWGVPAAAHWGAGPAAAHWGAGPVVAAHSAPIAHSASYVAANRGSQHVAPLPGHIQSVKSLNVQPAPGTVW